MKDFITTHPSVENFLGVLDEQAKVSAEATRNREKGTVSFTQSGGKHISKSVVFVHDSTQQRTSAAISSNLPSGLNIHHRLNLNNGAVGTGIHGQFALLNDRPESIVKGISEITLQVPRIPLVLHKLLGITPVGVIQKLRLLKIDSVFGEGAIIIGIDEKTVTIMHGTRIIKYGFPGMNMISSSRIDIGIHSELTAEIGSKMKQIRVGLKKVGDTFPIPIKKGGNNGNRDSDLLS